MLSLKSNYKQKLFSEQALTLVERVRANSDPVLGSILT